MTFLVYKAISSANISVTIIGITILYLFHLRYQSYSENGQPSFIVCRRSTAVPSVIIHLFHVLILGGIPSTLKPLMLESKPRQ